MAFDFSFDPDNRLVCMRASISIDLASTLEAMQALLSDARFEKGMKILTDLRDVVYAPTLQEVIALLQSPAWHSIVRGHKLAIVAGRPVQFVMANVLARVTWDSTAIEPFYSLDDARDWLRAR